MPASRSRTERWRECLRQIHERDGGLEISIPSLPAVLSSQQVPDLVQQRSGDLIWRVRVLKITETEIWVEQPSAAGATIELQGGLGVVAVMSIGQNRWMFITQTLGPTMGTHQGRQVKAMRLQMPEHVERCQRRNFYRVSTAELSLPRVECWPILNPTTVVAAEIANREQILELVDNPKAVPTNVQHEPAILPEVAPKFPARLVNVGGGGAGLLVDGKDAKAMDRCRYFWLRIDFTPAIPAPIAMTARLAHTHIDSEQNVYAGMAFEWSFNAPHKDFVVDQIRRYVASQQKSQLAATRDAA